MTEMAEPNRSSTSAQRLFFPEDGLDLPYTVVNRPGVVVITLDPKAMRDPLLADASSCRWIRGVRGRVIVDFSNIPMISSPCCGWLVHLVRIVKPATVSIEGANKRVVETMRLLGLMALMKIEDGP
jgi:hypothetical protein